MGPPPGASPLMRMAASWSGFTPIDRIQACGAMIRARWRAPLRPSCTEPPARLRRDVGTGGVRHPHSELDTKSPIQAEGKLLEVAVEMFEAHRPLMGAEDPSLEQREDQMNAGQYLDRGLIELGQHRDDVAIAGVAELGIAAPAVGVSGFAIAEVVVDEGGEDIGRNIGITPRRTRPQLLPRFSTAAATMALSSAARPGLPGSGPPT